MDPIIAPLLAVGSTIAGGVMGARSAAAQAKEAARREKYNQMMDAINTRFGVFGGGPTHRLGEQAAGPGTGTGGFLGAMGGLQTGLNIYSGLKDFGSSKLFGDATNGWKDVGNGISTNAYGSL